jgi:hypothetical protein
MNRVDLGRGLEQAWTEFMTFVPKLLLAIVILVVGYFVAKLLCRLLAALLQRVGFDRLVERGGIKRALARTNYDASGLLGRVLFYTVMLLVLEFAFGIFGPNPISAMLTAVIAFLPNVFAAVLIVIIASAIASAGGSGGMGGSQPGGDPPPRGRAKLSAMRTALAALQTLCF